jgi:hypothetical protein
MSVSTRALGTHACGVARPPHSPLGLAEHTRRALCTWDAWCLEGMSGAMLVDVYHLHAQVLAQHGHPALDH